ncbi:hypothetical protein [Streptomyces sp. YKOK-I1]
MTNPAVPGSPIALVLPLPTELPPAAARVGARLAAVQKGFSVPYVTLDDEPPAGSRVHDRFFAVRRARGDSAALLAGALLLSDVLVRDDLARNGSTLDEDPDNPLLGVTAFLADTLAPAAKHAPWRPADPGAAAQERWLVGHQRFFVMLQLLIVALQELDRPGATADEETAAVRSFGRICRSTSAAMRYAADFPPHLYGPVRDTMTPPAVNAGFSGLQTRDHHALVNLLRGQRRDGVFARLAPASLVAVHAAVQELYDAHVWVCARFGGESEPSLLMEQTGRRSAGAEPPESGVSAARRLAAQRLDHLG